MSKQSHLELNLPSPVIVMSLMTTAATL